MTDREMYPVIKEVKCSQVDGARHFELVLSRANLNHLLAGCPEIDCLMGWSRSKVRFCLFPDPAGKISDAFRSMPDGDGYFANIGAPVEPVPANVTHEEFEKLAEKNDERLIGAIRSRGPIPIEMKTSLGNLNIGYVTLKIETEK